MNLAWRFGIELFSIVRMRPFEYFLKWSLIKLIGWWVDIKFRRSMVRRVSTLMAISELMDECPEACEMARYCVIDSSTHTTFLSLFEISFMSSIRSSLLKWFDALMSSRSSSLRFWATGWIGWLGPPFTRPIFEFHYFNNRLYRNSTGDLVNLVQGVVWAIGLCQDLCS